jgi:Uma2 family endonuclease
MSTLALPLVTWTDFTRLPERPETGKRYELHDGEVVIAPPACPLHIKLQKRIEQLLESVAGELGIVTIEFPYRPVLNLQYWFADVAYVKRADWDAMPPNDYPIYAPPLIVEVLSPSKTPAKVNRQRIVAMSAGTEEFWVVDPERKTVQITSGSATRVYVDSETITLAMFGGLGLPVDRIFQA